MTTALTKPIILQFDAPFMPLTLAPPTPDLEGRRAGNRRRNQILLHKASVKM